MGAIESGGHGGEVVAGVPPAVEPWRPARRNHGHGYTSLGARSADPGGETRALHVRQDA
jgi:hypothetical protein